MGLKFEDNCTMVISTCDAYEDLWDPFFKILAYTWPDIDIPVVLNTEHKTYCTENISKLRVHNQKGEGELSWSKRLKDTLEDIDSKYIIFMLDDFFAKSPIDVARIRQCFEWMEADKRVAVFSFMQTKREGNKPSKMYEGFEKRPRCGDYIYNCQAALWNRQCLIDALADNENPWQWELLGSYRAYRDFGHDYYSLMPESGYVIDYIDFIRGRALGGLPVCRGRWYMDCVAPIFDKYGVQVDYSIRGEITADEIVPAQESIDGAQSLRHMAGIPDHYLRRRVENIIHIIKGY